MKSEKWLSRSCNILLNILFFPAVFYWSLSLDAFLQIRKAELFEYQYIPFSSKEDNIYSFRKSFYFTPEIAEYLSDGGKTLEYIYNENNQIHQQIINGTIIEFTYSKYGQLKSKRMIENNKTAEKKGMEK